jgi:hypothetical protein
MKPILLAFVLVAGLLSDAGAECFGFSLEHYRQHADLVFSGTIREVKQLDPRRSVVSLEVDRVCKGRLVNVSCCIMRANRSTVIGSSATKVVRGIWCLQSNSMRASAKGSDWRRAKRGSVFPCVAAELEGLSRTTACYGNSAAAAGRGERGTSAMSTNRTLRELREEFGRNRFLAMPLAGTSTWSAIGVFRALLPTQLASMALLTGADRGKQTLA